MRFPGRLVGLHALQFRPLRQHVLKPRKRRCLVAMLGAFGPRDHGITRGRVNGAHCAIGRILVLTAGTICAQGLKANIPFAKRLRRRRFIEFENADEPVLAPVVWAQRTLRHPLRGADP